MEEKKRLLKGGRKKNQIIECMRAQNYLRLSDLQKFLKKQYDVVIISYKVIIIYSKKRE